MILNKSLYRGGWDYIILAGPTILIDDGWRPILDYVEKELGQDLKDKERPCVIEDFNNETIVNIFKAHEALIKQSRRAEAKTPSGCQRP